MNSYIIISDLHDWDSNIANRVDYVSEIYYVKNKIYSLIEKELEMGNSPSVFFLGDIFHRGYKDIDSAINANNYYVLLSSMCKELASVIGNHELSYKRNNPFWTLMNNIEASVSKKLEPKGEINILRVPNIISDGEVSFYFNHYGENVMKPTNKVNILLSHNNISTKEIIKMAEDDGREFYKGHTIDFQTTGCLNGYSNVYLGHQHSIYGTWYYTNNDYKVKIQNLASLGRTNYREVNDNFLERTIPIIRVNDGKLHEIVDYKFNLPNVSDCLEIRKIEIQKKNLEVSNELKYILDYVPKDDSPLKNLKEILNDSKYHMLIDSLVSDVLDDEYNRLLGK